MLLSNRKILILYIYINFLTLINIQNFQFYLINLKMYFAASVKSIKLNFRCLVLCPITETFALAGSEFIPKT